MNSIKLKVCGLTKLEQINELISLKIDFLGFIFYEKSPRFVLNHLNLEEIKSIDHKGKVGVFVNETISKIIKISEKANLNFIQLHGDENFNFISELRDKLDEKVGIIKVFRIGNSVEDLKTKINHLKLNTDFFLFDTDSKSFGGTGTSFDWNLLNDLKNFKPFFLSGGISLENVENINKLNQKPFAIDINSKFEIEPGNKDMKKIKNLLELLNESPKGTI
jgi:phosphoribosylanthranilate isomerase